MNNEEKYKVFTSAGAGRFQFENKAIELTPEQKAKQEKEAKEKAKRQARLKSILRIAIGAAVLAGIAIAILVIFVSRNQGRSETESIIPEEEVTEMLDTANAGALPDANSTIEQIDAAIARIENANRQETDASYVLLLQLRMQVIANNSILMDEYMPTFRKMLALRNVDQTQIWAGHMVAADFARSNLSDSGLEIEILNDMIAILDEKGEDFGGEFEAEWYRGIIEERIEIAKAGCNEHNKK